MGRLACGLLALGLTLRPGWGQPGPPRVADLRISGNDALSSGQLKALMYTRSSGLLSFLPWVETGAYDALLFAADVERVRQHYRAAGFLAVQIDSTVRHRSPDAVQLELRVREGPRTRISQIAVTGLDSVAGEAPVSLRPGGPLSQQEMVAARQRLRDWLHDRGRAYGEVRVHVEREADTALARVTLAADPGPRCKIGAVHVTGNRQVADEVVRAALTFAAGQEYRRSELLATQRQLYRSGAFRAVTVTRPDSAERPPDRAGRSCSVPVVIAVDEERPNRLRLGVMLSTEETARGVATWEHRNFLGDARQLSVQASLSRIEQHLDVALDQPYLWNPYTWLRSTGFAEREDQPGYEVARAGGGMTLTRNLGARTALRLAARGEITDYDPAAAFTVFSLSINHDARDRYFDPRRGSMIMASVEESGWVLGSDLELLKVRGEVRAYRVLPLVRRIAWRTAAGAIWRMAGGAPVPAFRRFFAGGAGSVRGWGLNQLGPRTPAGSPAGGRSLLEFSVEIRPRIWGAIGAALFVDGGRVGRGYEAFDVRAVEVGAGAGLRYQTAIGPLRADAGYPLTADGGAKGWHYYLSVGQAF